MKKTIAIFMAMLMLFGFASCKDESSSEETTTAAQEYTEQDGAEDATVQQGETVTESSVSTSGESTAGFSETTAENVPAEADPSKWTDEEIVAFYKAAAIKSKTKVKSIQKMTLEEIVVNEGDGLLGTVVEWATPFFEKALEDSSTEFDGITGGYENIELSDMKSVKAYKSGEYTVVEMSMKEQTDGVNGDTFSGTVGHSISVVGDAEAAVTEALPQFNIGFEDADIKLHYSDPKLKVKINKDGIIEKGTWTYTVNITVANLLISADGFPLEVLFENAKGSVDYVITVGGGF